MQNKQRGSFTVEASIILPVILVCLMALIYFCVLLYQFAYIQSVADKTALMASTFWANPSKLFESGYISKKQLGDPDLYWRIIDLQKDDKKAFIEKYANSLLANGKGGVSNTLIGKSAATVDIDDYIVYKKIIVRVESSYKIPMGGFLKLIGNNGSFNMETTSETVINEPTEFIRNTDFILDTEKEIESKNPGLKKFSDGIRNVIRKIQAMVTNFFK